MTEPHLEHFPDPELLGPFIAETLADEPLRAVTAHLATCDECLAVLDAAKIVLPPQTRLLARPRVLPFRTPWLIAVAAALALVVGIGGTIAFLHARRDDRGGVRALISAAPSRYRTIEPRLDGFGWAELRRLRDDQPAPPDPESLRLAGAAGGVLGRGKG